jgi:hypothetical protein
MAYGSYRNTVKLTAIIGTLNNLKVSVLTQIIVCYINMILWIRLRYLTRKGRQWLLILVTVSYGNLYKFPLHRTLVA